MALTLLFIQADENYNTQKIPVFFVTQKIPASFIDPKKSLLAGPNFRFCQKHPSDLPISKIYEWGTLGL